MFFNSRSSNVKESERGKSVGCNLFSFTGVRFFEPKFMDTLNKHPGAESCLSKQPSEIKFEQLKPLSNSRIAFKSGNKENLNPGRSQVKQKQAEITLKTKSSQIQTKVCKIRGLTNIGNTCYMNSILQCLLNLNKFNSQLFNQVKSLKSSKQDVALEYSNLIEEFVSNSSSPFVPSKLKSAIGKKKCRFLGNAQQDAQQFLTALLQLLNEQTTRIKQKPKYMQLQNNPTKKSIRSLSQEWWSYNKTRDDSVVCDQFQGQLISVVTCKKCKNESVTFDNIWGLPLSLSKSTYSVSELIRNNWNIQNEISDYYCGVCKKHRDCTRKVEFFRLPEVLVIQLKRFEYGKWKKEKVKTPIKLSDTLGLNEFLNKNAQTQSHLYKLSGMVHHYGEVDYGHYTASVYKQQQKKWYLLNDSKANEAVPDSPSNTVYLLFYVRI